MTLPEVKSSTAMLAIASPTSVLFTTNRKSNVAGSVSSMLVQVTVVGTPEIGDDGTEMSSAVVYEKRVKALQSSLTNVRGDEKKQEILTGRKLE